MPSENHQHQQCDCTKRLCRARICCRDNPEIAKGWTQLLADRKAGWFRPDSELSAAQISLIESGQALLLEVFEPHTHFHKILNVIPVQHLPIGKTMTPKLVGVGLEVCHSVEFEVYQEPEK
jgi:hypothetical protein